MIAIGSVSNSSSDKYLFTTKVDNEQFARGDVRPWKLAQEFFDIMNDIPEHIIILDGDVTVAEYFAGDHYPSSGEWND